MTEPTNRFGVNGYVDLILVDRETKKVVKHVRQQNHLTEAFARWLFAANLGAIDSETRLFINSRTGYTDSDYFKGLITCNPVSFALGSFCRLDRQCQTVGSSGEFRMILLNTPVDINAATEIAPHLDSNLVSHNSRIVLYAGTYNSDDSAVSVLKFENNVTSWGPTGRNPSFTCSYMKDDEQDIWIKSVLLAGNTSSGYVWAERSAPVIVANKFDATWNNRKEITTNDNYSTETTFNVPTNMSTPKQISRFNQNTWDGFYVLVPFMKEELASGKIKTTDGIYSIAQDDFYDCSSANAANYITTDNASTHNRDSAKKLAYYDFGTKEYLVGTGTSLIENTVGPKGYFHPDAKMLSYFAGGFVLGVDSESNTILFKVSPVGVGSSIKAFLSSSWPTSNSAVSPTSLFSVVLTTDSNGAVTTSTTAFSSSAPVMVPRKQDTENGYGLVDIFFTPEYGEFHTDGYGAYSFDATKSTYGFGIHKATLDVGYYLSHLSDATVLSDSITYHNCVAVLPYAIGQSVVVSSGANTSNVTGAFNNTYCIGAYNDGIYYLPITHMFSGCKPSTWTMDDTISEKHNITLCCSAAYQPGVMLADKKYIRLGDYVFGHNGERRSIVTTDEGPVNLILNRTRHWQNTQSEVLSGVAVSGGGIHKESTQILVVKYTYTMEVYSEAPDEVTGASATNNKVGQIELTWTPSNASFIKLSSKEGSANDEGEYQTLVILNGTETSYTDTGLSSGQTKTYKIQGCREACKSPSDGVTVEGESL